MDGTVPTVFVVDDDGDVRSEVARLLRAHGMQVTTFASAREFLRCPRPDGPACLILDVRLTGEDGLRVQEALRTAVWRPPVIFLTGYGMVPQCVRALKGGAIDFLQKPVDDEALLAAIATALEQDARTRDHQRQLTEQQQRVATLTPREREVMGLLTAGLLNKEIASMLGTGEKTIKAYRVHVMRKMRAASRSPNSSVWWPYGRRMRRRLLSSSPSPTLVHCCTRRGGVATFPLASYQETPGDSSAKRCFHGSWCGPNA
jgi:FixJ family two-component response regulator